MLCFFLLLATVLAVVALPLEVSFRINNNPYSIQFEGSSYTLLDLSESFCRQRANDFNLKTNEDLIFVCIPEVSKAIRSELEKIPDIGAIPNGQFNEETLAWIAQARPGTTKQEVPVPPQSTPAFPTNFRVDIQSAAGSLPLVIDLNNFSLLSAAESFCRQRAEELGVATFEQLIGQCIPQVSEIIRVEILKQYDVSSLPVGQLSPESQRWVAADKSERDARAAAAQPATPAPPARTVEIQIVANETPYTLTAGLDSFTLLTTAESFCRQKATELGIDSMDVLVLRCIPAVANNIKAQLEKKFNAASIAEGNLSPASQQWFESYRKEQQAAEANARKAPIEIEIPIDGVTFKVNFDRSQSTPMAVAETICSSTNLNLQMDVIVTSCLPKVAGFIKQYVDARVAPDSVPIGESSPAIRDAITKLANSQRA